MRRITWVLAAAAMNPIACDCKTEPLVRTECAFTVEPAELDFNATAVGASSQRTYRLTNTGKGVTLNALATTLEPRNGDNYNADIPAGTALTPTDNQTFIVTFHPLAAAEVASSFVISHPDVGSAKCPTQTITVRGTGFDPPEVDAGFPDAGDDDAGFFDAGPRVDAGTVETPDGGVALTSDDRWFAYGAFEDPRARFVALVTKDGTDDVIAIGGYGEDGIALDSIERLNPRTGVSRVVAHMAVPRAEPAAATLADGRIVILGGRSAAVNGFALRTIEIFDPLHGDSLVCADPAGCGLDKQDQAVMTEGRIGAFASAVGSNSITVVLGRNLDAQFNEVPLAGGEIIRFSPSFASAVLPGAALLTARTDTAQVISQNGDFLVLGGNAVAAGVSGDAFVVDAAGVHTVTGNGSGLAFPRAASSAALLSTGDVLVAGGFSATGAGVVDVERIVGAFGAGASIETAGLQLAPRIGGSLLALDGDFLLWAGGMAARTDNSNATDSRLPQTSADVLVPFGVNNFVRLSPDNDLAQGRFEHQALAVSSSGGAVVDTGLFLGGVNTSPRRTPHPHVERYVLPENRFVTFGLMGPGTAIEAGVVQGSGAALVSAGGVDPHTGRTSTAVRVFDAVNGVYVEDGDLREPRRDHSLTRISVSEDNSMVVAGGRDENGVVLGSLSIFDTVNKIDRPLPVTLRTPRAGHTATRLADGNPIADGAVLLCGGQGQGGEALDTCEVFIPPSNPLDPTTYNEAAVVTVLGRMSAGRVGHTATLLDSGEVLLVGGGDITVDLVQADLFEPLATQPIVHPTGSPVHARRGHAAVFLGSGRVLIVGGDVVSNVEGATKSAELYVRANDAFLPLPDMNKERAAPAAFLLSNGDVLVAGGTRSNSGDPTVPTRSNNASELYVVAGDGTGTFNDLPDVPLSFGRSDIQFTDVFGRAIVTGGDHRDGIVTTGDERRTPETFVDFLQRPVDATAP